MMIIVLMIVMLIVQALADNYLSPIPALNMRFELTEYFQLSKPMQCDYSFML